MPLGQQPIALVPWPMRTDERLGMARLRIIHLIESLQLPRKSLYIDGNSITAAGFRVGDVGQSCSSYIMKFLNRPDSDIGTAVPQGIANEALIRFAGYCLQNRQPEGRVTGQRIGSINLMPITDHSKMFYKCGSSILLAPYCLRSAGICGDD